MGARSALPHALTDHGARGSRRDGSASPAHAPSHGLWRQVLGMIAWVGVMGFLTAGPVVASLLVVLGGVTLADAWISGIGQRRGRRSLLDRSPMAWGVAMALLLAIAYPLYLFNRKKLRTVEGANDYYWAIVVLGGIAYATLIVLVLIAALARTVA